MKTRIVLVETLYPENLGLTARAMKNFGFKELCVVNPIAQKEDNKAKSRAMHAQGILKKAKTFKTLKNALNGTTYSFATTARTPKRKNMKRNAISLEALCKNYANSKAKIAIVFGREDNGLTNKQIEECDAIISIPTNPKYRSLNLSHSVAITLYELNKQKKNTNSWTVETATKKELIKKFNHLLRENKKVRNKNATLKAFKGLISRSPLTKKEAKALISAFSKK